MDEIIKKINEEDKKNRKRLKSTELEKYIELEDMLNDYINELGEKEMKSIYDLAMQMAHLIIFLAEKDKEGVLFSLITDYLDKIIDKAKTIRVERGI
jgi:hypothetical protein